MHVGPPPTDSRAQAVQNSASTVAWSSPSVNNSDTCIQQRFQKEQGRAACIPARRSQTWRVGGPAGRGGQRQACAGTLAWHQGTPHRPRCRALLPDPLQRSTPSTPAGNTECVRHCCCRATVPDHHSGCGVPGWCLEAIDRRSALPSPICRAPACTQHSCSCT